MGLKAWYANIKSHKEKRLKERYSFILSAVAAANEAQNSQINHLKEDIKTQILALNNRIDILEVIIKEEFSSQQQLLCAQQSSTDIVKQFLSSQTSLIRKSIKSMDSSLNEIISTEIETGKKLSEVVRQQTDELKASFGETQSIVKLLAVNELLDEITVKDESIPNFV